MERVELRGLCASGGKAFGIVYRPKKYEDAVEVGVGHSALERDRFYRALNEAKAELGVLAEEAYASIGREESEIFLIHTLFLEDEDFLAAADRALLATHTAEYALTVARDYGISALLATGDSMMIARCDDLRDVCARVFRKLSGEKGEGFPKEPFLYVADDITPSEILLLTKSDCVGIVLRDGALQSHAAILANATSLPMLVKTGEHTLRSGEAAYLDADAARLIQPPERESEGEYRLFCEEKTRREKELLRFRDERFVYRSGRRLTVAANIGSLFECDGAMANGAEGIGLFRSELLFMESGGEPSEEEQFGVYCRIVKAASPHTAVLRVLDIGADKIPAWLSLDCEKNPALGLRGIRLLRRFPMLFERQLRAMLRASAYGNAVILLPMITSVDEVKEVKGLLSRLAAELADEGQAVGAYRLGVMIETPAAALECRALAEEVRYFSIGSNDLYQYTLAVDRENPRLLSAFDAHPAALLRLIDEVIAAAHEKDVTVSLCGALAGDPVIASFLLEREIDVLSLSLSSILPIKALCAEKLKNS